MRRSWIRVRGRPPDAWLRLRTVRLGNPAPSRNNRPTASTRRGFPHGAAAKMPPCGGTRHRFPEAAGCPTYGGFRASIPPMLRCRPAAAAAPFRFPNPSALRRGKRRAGRGCLFRIRCVRGGHRGRGDGVGGRRSRICWCLARRRGFQAAFVLRLPFRRGCGCCLFRIRCVRGGHRARGDGAGGRRSRICWCLVRRRGFQAAFVFYFSLRLPLRRVGTGCLKTAAVCLARCPHRR